MSQVPSDLYYTSSHEWVRQLDDDECLVGITDHAQELLGDLVFVELPDVETEVRSGHEVGVVESVKAASDVYAPLDGLVLEVNTSLVDSPELVNSDPYGDGWLYKVKIEDVSVLKELMSADDYEEMISAEE
jgi:glycine cleavage system H protein